MSDEKPQNDFTLQNVGKANELIYAASKKIREDKVRHTKITEKKDIERIKNILSKLPSPKERKISEISLRTNPRKWICSLLDNYPNIRKDEIELLLNDFSDSMQTRMREENKYAVAMLLKDELFLCHSVFGEETITPDWQTIPRMLDSDNVLRYIRFIKRNNEIIVKYYERWATESFVDWLGLPQKDAFYHFGGKYRIFSKIEDVDIVLELTEKEMDKWLEKHPEIRDGKIIFSTPISLLKINQIWVGKKKYENIGDFLQDLIAEKYSIDYYRRKFIELTTPSQTKSSRETKQSGPLELYIYKFFDERDGVVKMEGGEPVVVVEKTNPHIDILFVSERIEIRSSYLDDIFGRFINGEEINIIHAGQTLSAEPITIRTLKIWNKVRISELTKHLLEYYHQVNLQDTKIMRVIEFAIFKTLAESNKGSHIYYFLETFANRIKRDIVPEGRLTKLEDQILEFKPQEYFTGRDEDIISRLSQDISSKLVNSRCKIYLIGVEDDGTFNPIPSSRLKSDRVERIRQGIQEGLNSKVYLIPVIHGDKGILILIVGGQ